MELMINYHSYLIFRIFKTLFYIFYILKYAGIYKSQRHMSRRLLFALGLFFRLLARLSVPNPALKEENKIL